MLMNVMKFTPPVPLDTLILLVGTYRFTLQPHIPKLLTTMKIHACHVPIYVYILRLMSQSKVPSSVGLSLCLISKLTTPEFPNSAGVLRVLNPLICARHFKTRDFFQ